LVVIGSVVFSIAPDTDPVVRLMRAEQGKFWWAPRAVDEPYVELHYLEDSTFYGISLDAAEDNFGGKAVWVCPD
jgi:hypothetical protein